MVEAAIAMVQCSIGWDAREAPEVHVSTSSQDLQNEILDVHVHVFVQKCAGCGPCIFRRALKVILEWLLL